MKFNKLYSRILKEDSNYIPINININDILKDNYYLYSDKYSKYLPINKTKSEPYNLIIFLGNEPETDVIRYSIENNDDNNITVYKSNILTRNQKNIAIQNILNSIREDIFKPASPDEVKIRQEQGKLEEFKEWVVDRKYGLGLDKYSELFNRENINKKSRFGITPLMWLCSILRWGGEGVGRGLVEDLLKKGADPNIKTGAGETAINFANKYISNLLLKYGARKNNIYEDIFKPATPEEVNQRKNESDIELAKEIINRPYPLATAIHFGRYGTIKYLLEKGFDPNEKFDLYSDTKEYYICEVIDKLILFSNNPEAKNKWSNILKLFLEYGADPNVRDHMGYSPLYYLHRRNKNFESEIALLKKYGAKE